MSGRTRGRVVAAAALAALILSGCETAPDTIVQPPKLQTRLQPEYPPAARHAQQEGVVLLRVSINADGTVGEARVQRSSGAALLDASAVESVKKARFAPALTARGKAVPSLANLPVRFSLE